MATYFPSLLREASEAHAILNDRNYLQDAVSATRNASIQYTINWFLETEFETNLGPVGYIISAIQTALYLFELFSQPTRIDIQKEIVSAYFEPLTGFLYRNYCFPITDPLFHVMDSNDVRRAWDRRPDLKELAPTMYPQAQSMIDVKIGLQGYGEGMDERIVNQTLGNWERHGWSTQVVIDAWQGIVNAAGVGPAPNGLPPPGSAMGQAVAGMQVGALLYHKWDLQVAFNEHDWLMFADHYVQEGWAREAAVMGHAGSFYPAAFYRVPPGSAPPPIAPPYAGYPQPNGLFSPPCLQTQPPPPPPPPPQKTPYQKACQWWTLFYSGQTADPELSAFAADPANSGVMLEASSDPQCGYQKPGPQPTPYQRACQWWTLFYSHQVAPPDLSAFAADPANSAVMLQASTDPACGYRPQPPPPKPTPQQRACQYWKLKYANQPIPRDLLFFATDLANAQVMLDASHDPACGYKQPGPPPPQETPYQKACRYWLLTRSDQPVPEDLKAWAADPANYAALAEAACDPQCGYDPCQIIPPPPPPGDEDCPQECIDLIKKVNDRVDCLRPPWQGDGEWPPQPCDPGRWQWPWPQQPWPPLWPQHWPREYPPDWPKAPCDCPEPLPCICICPPPPPPEPCICVCPPPPPPPDTSPPPVAEMCTEEQKSAFYLCIWPDLKEKICDIAKRCARNLSCMRLLFCDIGTAAWGIMADCWLETNTNHVTYDDSIYRGLSFPQWSTEQFRLSIQDVPAGSFVPAIEVGTQTFLNIVHGNAQARPYIAKAPPYRGFIFTDPAHRDEGLNIRVPVPYPEEPDPCLAIEQGVSNG